VARLEHGDALGRAQEVEALGVQQLDGPHAACTRCRSGSRCACGGARFDPRIADSIRRCNAAVRRGPRRRARL
jgi:hypothetical protein